MTRRYEYTVTFEVPDEVEQGFIGDKIEETFNVLFPGTYMDVRWVEGQYELFVPADVTARCHGYWQRIQPTPEQETAMILKMLGQVDK